MNNILDQLNDSQRAAVEYCAGPQLVIAGAGSGKTRVLTYKIAWLLQNPETRLMPWNILALTFTNKAAGEMKERIGQLVGYEQARLLGMGTFHSVFSRILRHEAQLLGYQSNYTIYDADDSRSLVSTIVKELKLDDTLYKPANMLHQISMAKNCLITAEAYARDSKALAIDEQNRTPQFYKIYLAYAQRCKTANAMDFDDLLLNTYFLFKHHDDVRQHYAEQFAYILVDEYQDTNYAQQCIVYQLSGSNGHVCVVGDDAQSIYGFRGANIDNILGFDRLYPTAHTFKLEQNYRSTQTIVDAAGSLISHNKRQIPKEVFSENDRGERITFYQAYSDRLEASYVCEQITLQRRRNNLDYSQFAILYRTNAQSRCFEEQMRKTSIPYKIFGGLSFYQRKEIKDLLCYFRVVANPNDEEAMRRIINYPARGIGATTLGKVSAAAHAHDVSFWQVLCTPDAFSLDVNKGTATKLANFAQLISSFIDKSSTDDAFALGKAIYKQSGIETDLKADKSPEGLARLENVEELMAELQDFADTKREEGLEQEARLDNFMQEVALLTDKEDEQDADNTQGRVALMTVHAAKGLEFPVVFIVGMEENIFPSPRSCDSVRQLEEERRLLYVAITRAERLCYLTCAKTRYRYGHADYDIPSRFIKDIDPQYISRHEADAASAALDMFSSPQKATQRFTPSYSSSTSSPFGHTRRTAHTPSAPSTPSAHNTSSMRPMRSTAAPQAESRTSASEYGISIGSTILHQRFGRGEVTKIEGEGENTKATVCFAETGIKQLLLKFARFTVEK